MGALLLHCFTLILVFLILSSGSSADTKRLPLGSIKTTHRLNSQVNKPPFSTTIMDNTTPTTLPTLNPTSPTTTAPPTTTTTTTTPTTTPSSGGAWCIASPNASEKPLQVALDYACGYGGADCSVIQPGASCYNPNTVHDHASYAFNDYYQKNPAPTSCVFGGTARITNTDPSSGNCHYTSPRATASSMSLPTTPTVQTPPVTPMTLSPPSPYLPVNPEGGSVYGEEPTGSPSMAGSISQNILLLFSTISILVYMLITENV